MLKGFIEKFSWICPAHDSQISALTLLCPASTMGFLLEAAVCAFFLVCTLRRAVYKGLRKIFLGTTHFIIWLDQAEGSADLRVVEEFDLPKLVGEL